MWKLATALIVATGMTASAHAGKPERIAGGEGVEIAVYEAGKADGPPILFIHGYTQNHLAWQPQLKGSLADDFRLVAMDLRGHGASQKPVAAENYGASELWAEDVASVIRAKSLENPVLVGWSYGGYVIADYLRFHGDAELGGLVFVGAAPALGTEEAAKQLGQAFQEQVGGTLALDVQTNIESTRAFLKLVTSKPMDAATADVAFGSAMMVPARVRRALFGRQLDNTDVLSEIEVPTLVTNGREDRIVLPSAAREMAKIIPGARMQLYEGSGHAPFLEVPEQFNRDLAAFVRGIHAQSANHE